MTADAAENAGGAGPQHFCCWHNTSVLPAESGTKKAATAPRFRVFCVSLPGVPMLKRLALLAILPLAGLTLTAQGPRRVLIGDWPELRGPNRDGISVETGLPDTWALNGRNFLWRAPYGGRSTPVIMGNRLYVQNPAGRGAQLQERIMCLDVDTGKLVWEYKFNVFQ